MKRIFTKELRLPRIKSIGCHHAFGQVAVEVVIVNKYGDDVPIIHTGDDSTPDGIANLIAGALSEAQYYT